MDTPLALYVKYSQCSLTMVDLGIRVGNKIQTLSKVCPCRKCVQCLSMSNVCPEYVQCCNVTTDQGIRFDPCPMSVHVKFLSKVCPQSGIMSLSNLFWTMSWQTLDFLVQSLSKQLFIGPELYRLCTLLEREWMKIVFCFWLDGQWTGSGQGWDRDWILCPVSVQPTIG